MVYIHVPFCKSFCTYCDFYSEICSGSHSESVQSVYCDSLCREAHSRRSEIRSASEPRTLYFGGGTPSLLPLDSVARIVSAIDEGPYEEFTFEVNPEDIVEKGEAYVQGLLALGVNRISMGVQSLDDGILKWMNRRHDSATACEAVHILRAAGVPSLNLDIIFGISQLSDAMLDRTLEGLAGLAPDHISAYQLTLAEDSALAQMVRNGSYREAGEELCRRQYDRICAFLSAAGYHHYELSNWALPGREAIHNSAYWSRMPYVGLGPGAHSFDGRMRSWNSTGTSFWSSESETLSPEDERLETIMLGLRTARGLAASELRHLCNEEALENLLASDSLVETDGRIRIPEHHFFVSDDIIRELV